MKPRTVARVLDNVVRTFPAVVVTGPRQSGKTTLLRTKFASSHKYVNLENPDVRQRAISDPVSFLSQLTAPVILDEIQYAPDLLAYIKTRIDEDRIPGKWLFTGSQNFSLMQGITESLAGRAAILSLLPFSVAEREGRGNDSVDVDALLRGDGSAIATKNRPLKEIIIRGNYPEISSNKDVDRQAWCGSYVATYLERDIRNLKQVGDLGQFQLFLQACAVRSGQILDITSVARDIGVSFTTAKRWLSLLETGYQILLLYPYYKNIGKRLVKRPKIYFTDTGLLSYLIGLNEQTDVDAGPYWGSLFETLVVVDIWKRYLHHGRKPAMYYLRTRDGLEIDLVVESGGRLNLIEIKSTATIRHNHADSLVRMRRELGSLVDKTLIVSRASDSYTLARQISHFSWRDFLLR